MADTEGPFLAPSHFLFEVTHITDEEIEAQRRVLACPRVQLGGRSLDLVPWSESSTRQGPVCLGTGVEETLSKHLMADREGTGPRCSSEGVSGDTARNGGGRGMLHLKSSNPGKTVLPWGRTQDNL